MKGNKMLIVYAIGGVIAAFVVWVICDLISIATWNRKRIDTHFTGFDSAWSKLREKGYRLERDMLGGWYVVDKYGNQMTNEVLNCQVDVAMGNLEAFAKAELDRLGDG